MLASLVVELLPGVGPPSCQNTGSGARINTSYEPPCRTSKLDFFRVTVPFSQLIENGQLQWRPIGGFSPLRLLQVDLRVASTLLSQGFAADMQRNG
jgi:hypothetical protein